MARKKQSTFSEWQEPTDETAVEAEVTDEGYYPERSPDPAAGASVSTPTVTLIEQPTAPEPELSETTKAEQEAGRKALEERAKSRAAE